MLWSPPGVTFSDSVFGLGCASFDGIHLPLHNDGGRDAIAYVPRCDWPTDAGWSILNHLTEDMSHEVAESVTDPVIEQPDGGLDALGYRFFPGILPFWAQTIYNSVGETEVGDLCQNSMIQEGPSLYLYQRIWSISAAGAGGDPCVPARPEPYINVKVPRDWYAAQAGQTVLIPVTGFAAGPTTNWSVHPHWRYYPSTWPPMVTPTFASDAGVDVFGGSTINDGIVGTLAVTLPTDAQRGDMAIIDMHSGYLYWVTDPSHDESHSQYVGVYVP
jgi:hypothetical protein